MQLKYWILSAGLLLSSVANGQTPPPTLQQVTEQGNTTDRSIILGNGTVSSMYSYGSSGVVLGTTTSHPLSLFANNTASIVLLPNGNIGMGSGSPIYKLHLYSAGNTNTAAAFLAGEYYGPLLGVKGNSSSHYALNVVNNVTAPAASAAGSNSLLYVRADGNVGIGTGTPAYKLDVNGAATVRGNIVSTISDPNIGGRIELQNPAKTENGAASKWAVFNMGGTYGNSLQFWSYDNVGCATGGLCASRVTFKDDGNVGIGITAPAYKLDVAGTGNFSTGVNTGGAGNTGYNPFRTVRMIGGSNYTAHFGLGAAGGAAITSQEGNNNRVMLIRSALTYPEYSPDGGNTLYPIWHGGNLPLSDLLRLSNGILASDLTMGTTAAQRDLNVNGKIKTRKITVTQSNWPDYVFDSSYQLKPLHQVEQYIQQNKHLPDVPSAETVNKDGVDVGDNQALLLKKIEELTLYIIQQNKEIKAQNKELLELKQEVKALKTTKQGS